ncbi:MAG: hypothetical protein HY867_06395 [Chloroflexi bacterium]|nr:hypothetical protein [Chloroflexota bacterium]
MDSFLLTLKDIFSIFGYFINVVGFFVVGFGLGRFFIASYPKGNWELQIALALGFFGLLIGITVFATPGSAGAFALGVGLTFFVENQKKEEEAKEKPAEKPAKKK